MPGTVWSLNTQLPWLEALSYIRIISTGGTEVFYFLPQGAWLPSFEVDMTLVQGNALGSWEPLDSTGIINLSTTKDKLLYQYFFGVLRDALVHLELVTGEQTWTTDALLPSSSNRYLGKVNAKTSPFNAPSPASQLIIVKGITPRVQVYNQKPEPVKQRLNFIGKVFVRLEVKPELPPPVQLNDQIRAIAKTIDLRRIQSVE